MILQDKKLLLLVCCAPCCVAVVEELARQEIDATLFFYNPNIFPRTEYEKRKSEVLRIAKIYNMPVLDSDYSPEDFSDATKGLEGEPEGGLRCSACFFLRLSVAAKAAQTLGFDAFASTLGFSRWKNLAKVNVAGNLAEKKFGNKYLAVGFRELQGRARELVATYKIYNQNYCGCKYSMRKDHQ